MTHWRPARIFTNAFGESMTEFTPPYCAPRVPALKPISTRKKRRSCRSLRRNFALPKNSCSTSIWKIRSDPGTPLPSARQQPRIQRWHLVLKEIFPRLALVLPPVALLYYDLNMPLSGDMVWGGIIRDYSSWIITASSLIPIPTQNNPLISSASSIYCDFPQSTSCCQRQLSSNP